MRALILIFALCLAGCFNNASAQKTLSDTVHELNEASRWGRNAIDMVEPSFRQKFAQSRAHWGELLKVADHEIVHVQLAADKSQATAVVVYEWYLFESMTLHRSVVRQRWTLFDDHYGLSDETVVKGDRRLLDPRAEPGDMAVAEESATLLGDPTDY